MCAYAAASTAFITLVITPAGKNRSKYIVASSANGAALYCARALKQWIAQNGQ
jgi:hypothetical protein